MQDKPRHRAMSALLRVAVIATLLLPAAGVTQAGPTSRARQTIPSLAPTTQVAPNDILSKLDPALRELARTAVHPDAADQYASAISSQPLLVRVLVAISPETGTAPDLSAMFVDGKYYGRPIIGKGADAHQLIFGQVYPFSLNKLAGVEAVQFISAVVLEQNGQPDPYPADEARKIERLTAEQRAERAAAWQAQVGDMPAWDQARAIGDGYVPTDGGQAPEDWFEASLDGPHKAEAAWARGYTGDGVTVAVLDDGIDAAHPDLMGTQRIYSSTERSEYNGWPMVYSPFSALLYFFDEFLGTSYIEDGYFALHYVDTSAMPSLTPCGPGISCFPFTPMIDVGTPGTQHTYMISDTMSASGDIHVGTHPDFDLIFIYGERPAILVTDPNSAGDYDTVYVDLNNNFDFRDEKPLTRADVNDLANTANNMVAYRDINSDGKADISGGMLYFIANGVDCIAGTDYIWGCGGGFMVPSNGDMVAFSGGSFDRPYSHGTQIASNIAGQGVANGLVPKFGDLPGDGYPAAAVLGMAPDAKLVNVADIYYDFDGSRIDGYLFAAGGFDACDQTGFDLLTAGGCTDTDAIQITNNSYGESDVDNDGWDFFGQVAAEIQFAYAPFLQHMFSTGNGAPGYGTTAPPSPFTAIAVGASTEFGSTGWDSISYTTQIMNNDVIPFSNRGPGARGTSGVDVVAGGAYAAGAEELNYYTIGLWGTPDGNRSWDSWGGTSRSSPVAAGVLALIVDAYEQANGTWPDYEEMKALLMSTATDLDYDTFTQGAGSVNADRGTAVAGELYGLLVEGLADWNPGEYRGDDYPGFAHVVYPGDAYTKTFTIENTGTETITASIDDSELMMISSQTVNLTITPEMVEAEEALGAENSDNFYKAFNFFLPITATDSVIANNADWSNVTIPAGTDLMIVRMMFPQDQYDLDGDYATDNRFYLNLYNWQDINGDYDVWDDLDANGVVNFVNSGFVTQIDGGDELVWDDPDNELDRWEFGRFGYHRPEANTVEMWVQHPTDRMIDGLFIGLRHHPAARASITTTMDFRFEFYQEEDVTWLDQSDANLQIAPGTSETFDAVVNVPGNIPTGMYQAAIQIYDPGTISYTEHTTIIPVAMTVVEDFTGGTTLGGYEAYNYDAGRPYNNGAVRGLHDWGWRAESGDWRFFMVDALNGAASQAPAGFPAGTQFLVRDDWEGAAPWTDIDTIVLGPTANPLGADCWYCFNYPPAFGPYVLDTVGGSVNTNVGAGTWLFETASGGNQEWVAAPLQDGLHAFLQHNVLFDGTDHEVVFTKTVGTLTATPTSIITTTTVDSATIGTIAFEASINLNGVEAEGFGLSRPEELVDLALPFGGGYDFLYDFTVEHGAVIEVSTASSIPDIDLYLLYCGPEGNDPCTGVASSAGGDSDEALEVVKPEDGVYLVAVDNFSGPAGTFDLTIFALQGTGLSVTGLPVGAVPANTEVELTVSFNQYLEIGETYQGLIFLGPPEAPEVVQIDVQVTRAGYRWWVPIIGK